MALETERGRVRPGQALNGVIKQAAVCHAQVAGQRLFINGKAVVLAGDRDAVVIQVLHRVIGPMMTKFHFVSLAPLL